MLKYDQQQRQYISVSQIALVKKGDNEFGCVHLSVNLSVWLRSHIFTQEPYADNFKDEVDQLLFIT